MRRRDGSKKSRFERQSLMPHSERQSQYPPADRPSYESMERKSWMPPAEAIVVAKLQPDAGWEEYETSGGNSMIPQPPTTRNSVIPRPPTTRNNNMIPPAPTVPRMSVMPERPPSSARTASLHVPPPPRASSVPTAPPSPRASFASSAFNGTAPAPTPVRSTASAADPWERMSLTPAAGFASLAPSRAKHDNTPEDDRRYNQALLLREQGRNLEAMLKLDEMVRARPEHADARTLLHKLATELGNEEKSREHADWVVNHYATRGQHANTCVTYRVTRMAFPQLEWSERALLQALVAGDKGNEARVVLDATKLLLQSFPNSHALPRALYASAQVQHDEGRPDLSRATLNSLLQRFPMDPLASVARRKLSELG